MLKAKVLNTNIGNIQMDITVRYSDDELNWQQDVVIIVPEEQFSVAELFINKRIVEEGMRYKNLLDVYKVNNNIINKEFNIG